MADPTSIPSLTTVFESSQEVEVDIVAVHGMAVDSDKTWKLHGIHWLKDPHMLPSCLPPSRIMIFSYDSTYYGQTAIAQRLSLIAEQLLRELISSRSQCRRRPILFVGHCFGGIVIEKALVLAKLRIEEYGMILQSTAGAVFLGTPHRGTAAQTLVRQVLVILSIFRRVEPGLLQLLRLNSESLRDLLYDFTLMVHEVDIPLFCFFEQHPTDIMRAMRYGLLIPAYLPLPQWPVLIADETSSCIDGYYKLGLNADHFSLNKFASPTERNFILVSTEIARMVTAAIRQTNCSSNSSLTHQESKAMALLQNHDNMPLPKC